MGELKNRFPTKDWVPHSKIDFNTYKKLYNQSISQNDLFWEEQAKRLEWSRPWTKVKEVDFHEPVTIRWYLGAELNACFNCVDRHLPQRKDQVAYYWVPEDPNVNPISITYGLLYENVVKWAHLLAEQGVKAGDRVTVYLPMIPEAIYAMLACARIGAPHSVIFAGFSPESISDRINDCESDVVITADFGIRGGQKIPLKANVDKALETSPRVRRVIVVNRTGEKVAWNPARDVWAHERLGLQKGDFPPARLSAEHPLFLLYTSGSTNKPKGVLHTTGGYLVYASLTHQIIFDYKTPDVYWCAADIGWVTGHSYIVYGPLSNGATSILYEGLPTFPTPSRIWEIVDQYQVKTLYTAPTLIRALMAQGDEYVLKTKRSSLRLLGSVGEPINPEAWNWYHRVPGGERCPIVDTWWQTETGGIMISPLPGAFGFKPGSATKPFFGVDPVIVNEKGEILEGACEGHLCLRGSWPGQMRTVYRDHERFFKTYFSTYPGLYFTGDGCKRDQDGDYWITGRVDDVLNVSGHRLGTAEIESALVAHEKVAEAAVVGFPHDIKGTGIYAFVTLNQGEVGDAKLAEELKESVKKHIGGLAKPDAIQFAPQLPKTRSGKIMRRILRKIASQELENLGDTSTLSDPNVVQNLIQNRIKS